MTLQALQTISQSALLAGLLIAAFGGFGSYWFGSLISQEERERSAANEQRLLANQEEIKKSLQQKADSVEEDLLNRYPLGFGLLYTDGRMLVFVDRTRGIKVDWATARVLGLTEDQIVLRLPDWRQPDQELQVSSAHAVLQRRTGRVANLMSSRTVSMRAEIVETGVSGAVVAIGYRPKDNPDG